MAGFRLSLQDVKIGIIGLGYVGLPLAVEFARRFPVIGFDISASRIDELKAGRDASREVEPDDLRAASGLTLTNDADDLSGCNAYIVTVPTPIDKAKNPDLGPLIAASDLVGGLLETGDIVIYESTVYPGATEEVCVPVLEHASGLKHNVDFYTGYSPERINPGDKAHGVTSIKKVTSGSSEDAANFVDQLYSSVIVAGTHKASSRRVAEAAKVIENTQRDVNIALINELAIIFNKLGIDTQEVLKAAGSKWNFLPFAPGLVGGHCIGVDPYYLTHKAQSIGYHPEMILAGRRINDAMGIYVSSQIVKMITRKGGCLKGARVLILGLSFKENCPDIRNTRVVDIIDEMASYGATVDVHDPWVDMEQAKEEYGIKLTTELEKGKYDAVVLAVAHREFCDFGARYLRSLCKPNGVLYDVKSVLDSDAVDGRL